MLRDSESGKGVVLAKEKGLVVRKDGSVIGLRGRLLEGKPTKGMGNYIRVSVHNGPKKYTVPVHKLQAYQKFGDAVFSDLAMEVHIRHLNGDPTDNSWDNIALGSSHDNIMDRTEAARKEHARKAVGFTRVFSEEQIREIRRRKLDGESLKSIADSLGKSKGHISDIVNGKLYSDVH